MDLDADVLKKNLYISQALGLVLGLGLIWFLYVRTGLRIWQDIFGLANIKTLFTYGTGIAVAAIALQIALYYLVPHHLLMDDGTNQLIYSLPYVHLILIFWFGSFSEEILFRATVQTGLVVITHSTILSILGAGLVFTVLHIRYLGKPVLFTGVFVLGVAFGWLYAVTGTIWPSVYAHFIINLVMACLAKKGLFIPKSSETPAGGLKIMEK